MGRIHSFLPVLEGALLDKNNFFEMYPFDGGGGFIQQGIVHSTNDFQITENILHKGALDEFGPLEEIDFLKYGRWSTIEKSCWINRLYFIVPLAKTAKATQDRTLAEMVRHILLRFADIYKGPQTQEAAYQNHKDVLYARDHDYNAKGFDFDAPIDYQWFDFQVGSRIINILYALYFLRDMEVFSDSDLERMDGSLLSHARNIYWVETLVELYPGNHQALRAMALLMASIYFRDLPEADEWRSRAAVMCEYHILNGFLEDGMMADLSPSYHFFETWIIRDMIQLGKQGNICFAPEVLDRAEKAFRVCRTLCMVDSCCPAVNDAYSFDLSAFLATLPPDENASGDGFFFLEQSSMAFYRNAQKGVSLMLDSSPLKNPLAHYHGGKQALIYYAGGKPFLVDSGCCSYDDPDFSEWYKQPQAHSTLLVSGKGDAVLQGRYQWLSAPHCVMTPWKDDHIETLQTSEAPGWEGVSWKRKVTVAKQGEKVIVEDFVRAPGSQELTLIFNLHPAVTVECEGNCAVLRNGSGVLRILFEQAFEIKRSLGYRDFTKVPAKQLHCTVKASEEFQHKTVLELLS